MTDSQTIDPEKLKQDAIEGAKQALVESIMGNKPKFSWEERGRQAPETYDELFSEVKKHTPTLSQEEIDARVDAKIAEREAKTKEQEQETAKKQAAEIEERRKVFDSEWYSLVKEGKMPAPSQEIQDRINKGEKLTLEEMEADEGLKARLELVKLSQENSKGAKLTYYEDYGKDPAGIKAPVFGSRPSVTKQDGQELEYDDIKSERKRIFGF